MFTYTKLAFNKFELFNYNYSLGILYSDEDFIINMCKMLNSHPLNDEDL